VILWRVLAWDPSASLTAPGGPLWFPRPFQGTGRHDNPERYGCLYVAEEPVSAVAEQLAPFRGSGELRADMLERRGLALGLAELELDDGAQLVDLDEPRVLTRERLRPSTVATRRRSATQAYAERVFDRHADAAGLRWWSTLESSWINVTLFDRSATRLAARDVASLAVDHPAVAEAAEMVGLA
jgi:hypothetical protein